MIKFDIVTLFPELFNEHLKVLPLKRAREKGFVEVNFTNLRDFAIDARGSVDDKTYGGGVGMVIRPEPVFEAVESILAKTENIEKNDTTHTKRKIILLSPKGEKFTQKKAQEYLKMDQIIFICGRYEGIDARVEEHLVDEIISIGDYVLSGGEIPTMVILEAITRLIPGVLEKEDAIKFESFSQDIENAGESLEYPQYTRPEDYRGMKVPEILLSGNHKEIEKWRKEKIKK